MRPYMRAANVTWAGISVQDVKEMDFSPKEFETYELKEGDVLLSEASGSAAEVGKPAIWRGQVAGCCFQNTLIRVRSRGPLPEYLHLHFLADARLGRFAAVGKGVGINHLGADKMASWPIALPPPDEQRRIVAKLEALQARSRRAREALDAVPPLLEKLRQSILAAAFRGDLTKDWRAKHKDVEPASKLLERIRAERRKKWEEAELAKMKAKGKLPKGDAWKAKYKEPAPVDATGLPELPEGWCWASLESLLPSTGDLFDGPFGSALKTDDYVLEGVRVIRLENVANLEFRGEKETFISRRKYDTLTRHTVGAGDIIFGSFVEESTRVCLLPDLGGPAIAKADCFCVRPDAAVIRADLLVLALGSHHARTELARGIHGATRSRINTGQLRSLRVPLPPRNEQEMVLERVEAMLAVVRNLARTQQQSGAAFSTLDRAVLAKGFRGDLVRQNPNDEPAEVILARVPSLDAAKTNGAGARASEPGNRARKSIESERR